MAEQKLKTVSAKVISKSGDKSFKIIIEYKVKHPKYGKYVKRQTMFMVHDEHNQAAVGDTVEVAKCRPYSKNKSWRLVNVLEQSSRE